MTSISAAAAWAVSSSMAATAATGLADETHLVNSEERCVLDGLAMNMRDIAPRDDSDNARMGHGEPGI